MISHAELVKILRYDPITGDFIWIVSRRHSKMKVGDIAGTTALDGYRRISISGKKYYHHGLAFFYMTGRWPAVELDHKDLNRANNRWNNLREATRPQNKANKKARVGLKGAFRHRHGRWRAVLSHKGKIFQLGIHDTEQEAHEAYMAKARALHGEFARAA